jgi:hypothetical protein
MRYLNVSKRLCLLILASIVAFSSTFAGRGYYFNSETGKNANDGTRVNPFRDLSVIEQLKINPGDSVLLTAGNTFYGSVKLSNTKGTKESPIYISTYNSQDVSWQTQQVAVIDARSQYAGIHLQNCRYIKVENIMIQANAGGMMRTNDTENDMRCGIFVTVNKPGIYGNITLLNLVVKDIFYESPGFTRSKNEVKTPNGTQRYGWGIRFINNTRDAQMEDLIVQNCIIQNVAHTGIKFTGSVKSIRNIKVANCVISNCGGPGIQMSGVENGYVVSNTVNRSGCNDDTRKWGRGSGLWTWSTSNVLIEKNKFLNANGPGDSAGAHIDYNCYDVVLQYNLSANNAGGFCEILGNNHNCAYRYNISVNDGYRVKGEKGAFQEGKVFWLSGYVGNKKPFGPFNSYFYNNTIYVKEDIVAKFAVAKTSEGIFVANNIFMIAGSSSEVVGDQYVPESKGDAPLKNVFFENNLYLRVDNWPASVLIQDQKPIYGDPGFVNPGGFELRDYMPVNKKMIKNKGVKIHALPNDSIGLKIGLKVRYDILGNPIKGKPDMGAIEL